MKIQRSQIHQKRKYLCTKQVQSSHDSLEIVIS